MRNDGAGPSVFAKLFAALLGAVRAAGNGLLCFLALHLFYPLAAWPVGRAVRRKNDAQNAPQSPAGSPVLNQLAPDVCGLRCGHGTVGVCGCGPVSVYNALCLLGRAGAGGQSEAAIQSEAASQGEAASQDGAGGQGPAASSGPAVPPGRSGAAAPPAPDAPDPSLAGVIGQFERRRALALGGRAGASPRAVGRVLRQYGLAAAPARSPAALEAALPPGGVGILMIWNEAGHIRRGAHFFAVQRARDGKGFAAYNSQPSRADTLTGLIGGGRFAAGWRVSVP